MAVMKGAKAPFMTALFVPASWAARSRYFATVLLEICMPCRCKSSAILLSLQGFFLFSESTISVIMDGMLALDISSLSSRAMPEVNRDFRRTVPEGYCRY